MNDDLLHKDLTDVILKSFYEVYNELGYGFLESVCQNALIYELRAKGLIADAQKKITVRYKDIIAGTYYADIMVNSTVILELKACETLIQEHQYQLINYLRSTDCEVGLLLNFGKRPQFMRKVFDNNRK
jgi:GxxExxY protein